MLSNKKKRVNKYILFCFILQFSSPNGLSFLCDVERIVPNFSARWQGIDTVFSQKLAALLEINFFSDDSVEMYDNDQELYSI